MRWLWTTSFLGSSLLQWATAGGVFLAVFLALLLLRRLVVRRLGRVAERTPTGLDNIAVEVARRTRALLILVPAAWLGSLELELLPGVRRALGGAAEAAVFLQVALWASLAVDLWVARAQRRRLEGDANSLALAGVLRFVAKVTLWAILLLAALDNLGVNVTTLVTGLGIGGIAVALALQNVLSDLLASLAIIFDKPFVLGDSITVDEMSGTVEAIGLKTTRLRSVSGEQIILANGELLKSRIRNWKRMSERRALLAFGIPVETPAELAAALPEKLRRIIDSQGQVRFERAHFKGFGDSALTFEAVYWILTPDYTLFMDRQQAIGLALLRLLQDEGIGLAVPTRTLLVDRNLPPGRP